MKQLEEIIRERLAGYESKLPEGDLDEFRAMLDKKSGAGTKRKAEYLAWLSPLVVAAGLALFFIIHHTPEYDAIRTVDNETLAAHAIVPMAADSNSSVAANPTKPAMAHKVQRSDTHPTDTEVMKTCADTIDKAGKQTPDDGLSGAGESDNGAGTGNASKTYEQSPPDNLRAYGNNKKVGPATAGVIAGAGAVALAKLLPSELITNVVHHAGETLSPMESETHGKETGQDIKTGNSTHCLPVRAGLSMRIPFSERWSLTTGVDYSWYSSEITYSFSGTHKQDAHYIGIPVRADYSLARNRRLEVYAGAGVSADFCIAAFDAGHKTDRDGVGFSVVGAGGIQFNITDKLGIYLDPAVSWNIPSDNKVLDTYKSENPLMFSVLTGIRFSIQRDRLE